MKKISLLPVLAVLLYSFSFSAAPDVTSLNEPDSHVYFTENKGQWEKDVLFGHSFSGLSSRFMTDGVSFGMISDTSECAETNVAVWKMKFLNALAEKVVGKKDNAPIINYYLPNVRQEKVKSYKEVWFKEMYPGTDIRYYGLENGEIEYDVILAPGAKVSNVQFVMDGVEELKRMNDGRLSYQVQGRELFLGAPYAYQLVGGKRVKVTVEYELKNQVISYKTGTYDPNFPLIIDPMILEFSTFAGGGGQDEIHYVFEHDGDFYLWGTTQSTNFPVDPGAYQLNNAGSVDLMLGKFDTLGNLLIATYLGGSNMEAFQGMEHSIMVDGDMMLFVTTMSTDFPLTASPFQTAPPGMFNCPVFCKVNENLQLVYASYLGRGMEENPVKLLHNPVSNMVYGIAESFGGLMGLPVTHPSLSTPAMNSLTFMFRFDNSTDMIEMLIATMGVSGFSDGYVALTDAGGIAILENSPPTNLLPTTAGALPVTLTAFDYYSHLMVLDANDNVVFGTHLGGAGQTNPAYVRIKNNRLYGVGTTYAPDFPVTPGSFQPVYGGNGDSYICAVDLNTNNVIYSSFLGGSSIESLPVTNSISEHIDDSDNFYLWGTTMSFDFPVTPGALQPILGGFMSQDIYLTLIDPNGVINFSTYVGCDSAFDQPSNSFVDNGGIAIVGVTSGPNFPVTADAFRSFYSGSMDIIFAKISNSGVLEYGTYVGGSNNETYQTSFRDGDEFYLIGNTNSMDFSVTPSAMQAALAGFGDYFITKIDASNSVPYSTFYGNSSSENLYLYTKNSNRHFLHNGKLHLLTAASDQMMVSPGAIQSTNYSATGGNDIHYARLNATTGNFEYGTFLGGADSDVPFGFFAYGKKYYLFGSGTSGFPVTEGAFQEINGGGTDWSYVHFDECPQFVRQDTLTPDTQTVCSFSTPDALSAPPYYVDSLPNLIIDGVVIAQPQPLPADLMYQWLMSTDEGITWSAAPAGVGQNYNPPELSDTAWFKRVIINCCGDTLGETNTAVVFALPELAPIADAGDSLYICNGGSILLGGATSGGTAPYDFLWTPAAGLDNNTLEFPTASPTETTAYVLEVTDDNGCTHLDQVTVHVVEPDAGPDVPNCSGQGVLIGTPGLAGVQGINYSWLPTTGLNNPSIPQPTANPLIPTIYTLTMTGPNGCPLTDDVTVTPVTFPSAGSDTTICRGESPVLGNPALPGYSYIWSPSQYLSNPGIAQPTFFSAGPMMEVPQTYTVTIVHNASGCSITEEVKVYINYVEAGLDMCIQVIGPDTFPTQIGEPALENPSSSYEWSVLSGDPSGGFLTDSLSSVTVVLPSTTTLYELTSTLNGVSCSDTAWVVVACSGPPSPGGGGCPLISLGIDSDADCAIADTLLNTTLTASLAGFNSNLYFHAWTPTTGLGTPDSVTTTVSNFIGVRWYSFNIYSLFDSTLLCQDSIAVFGENTQFPLAVALDTIICEGETVVIGDNVAQPNKIFEWSPGMYLSDPTGMNPSATPPLSMTYILTVTDTATGCYTRDTALVLVRGVGADAGPDQNFCDGVVVTLGTAPLPNRTYHWEPSLGLSEPDVAQPTDTIYAGITYILTVTDTITGCIQNDTVVFTEVLPPTVNIVSSSVDICQGGHDTLSPDVFTPGYEYSWSPSLGLNNPLDSIVIASPPNTTNYQLIVTDGTAIGCHASDQIQVNVLPDVAPIADAGNDADLCLGSNILIGSADLGHTYAWLPTTDLSDPSIANPIASPTSSTTYQLTVTSVNGCTNTDNVVINVAPPGADQVNNQNACMNASTYMGTWSQPGYTYSWSPAGEFSNPNASSQIFFPTQEATYVLTITEPSSCVVTYTYNLTLDTAFADAGPDKTHCGSAVQIGTPALPGYSYFWVPFSSGLDNNFVAQPNALPTAPTDYVVTATAPNGCNAKDTVHVSEAIMIMDAPDVSICPGASIQIGPIDPGGVSYTWNDNYMISSTTVAQPVVSPLVDTVYTLEVTDGLCTSYDTVRVDVAEFTTDAGDISVLCQGMCIQIGPLSQPGFQYQWSPSTGLSDPNVAQPIACPLSTTTYSLLVRDLASGCEANDEVLLIINSTLPPIADAGPDQEMCPGQVVAIGSASEPNMSYVWTPNNNISSTNTAQPTVSPTSTETYILTVTNDTTSCSASDTVNIEVFPQPPLPLVYNITICEGGSTIIGNHDDANTYLWIPASGLSDNTIGNPVANPDVTTTYSVVVTDTNGCTTSSDMTVTVVPGTGFSADAGPDILICRHDTVQLGTPDIGGGATYFWDPFTFLSSPFSAQPDVMPTGFFSSMTYLLTVTQAPCQSMDEVTVTALSEINVEAGPDQSTCTNEVTLSALSPSPGVGQWSVVTGPNSPNILSPNSSVTNVENLIPGVYTFQWSVSGEVCNPGIDQLAVEVYTAPILVVNPPAPACPSVDLTDPAILSGSVLNGASLSYWVDAALTIPIADPTNVNVGGTYYIAAQNSTTGCTDQEAVPVILNCSAPLNTRMLSFRANREGVTTQLEWSVAQSMEVGSFEIERSVDGVSFHKIIEISVSTNQKSTYSTIDYSPVSGVNFYRLKVLDVTGGFHYSEIKQVVFDSPARFLLYPNPSQGLFWVETIDLEEQEVSMEVTNLFGQQIYSNTFSATHGYQHAVDLTGFSSATYLVKISYQGGQTVFKVIKR